MALRTLGNSLFPTLVVGSLPRPEWVRQVIENRKDGRISRQEADRLFDSAIPGAIRMQERAGLDFVSDGEWRRESYVKVFAEAVGGGGSQFTNLAYPAVVSQLTPQRSVALDEARFLRANTGAKVIVALPSAYTIGRQMWSQDHSASAYPTREEFMMECVPIIRTDIRTEIQGLIELGVDAIQLEIPGWPFWSTRPTASGRV